MGINYKRSSWHYKFVTKHLIKRDVEKCKTNCEYMWLVGMSILHTLLDTVGILVAICATVFVISMVISVLGLLPYVFLFPDVAKDSSELVDMGYSILTGIPVACLLFLFIRLVKHIGSKYTSEPKVKVKPKDSPLKVWWSDFRDKKCTPIKFED